jgi:hypothetical protein
VKRRGAGIATIAGPRRFDSSLTVFHLMPLRGKKGRLEMKDLRKCGLMWVVIAALFVLSGSVAYGQSEVNRGLPWDALIELSGGSVAAGIGFSWGSGTLTQAGNTYPLKIKGLSVGSVGVTKASAWGRVYHLKDVSDINGTYTALGTGATVGGGGAAITMGNSKGVIIDLFTTTQGAHLTVGTGGLTIEMKK